MAQLQVGIVGGSIAGCTLAAELLHAGIDPDMPHCTATGHPPVGRSGGE